MKSNRGFTLIEMLIVIAIIAILSGIVLVGVTGFQASARDTQAVADLRFTQNLIELYYTRNGSYPSATTWSGLIGGLTGIPGVNKLPTTSNFRYTSCSFDQGYLLAVTLEGGNSASKNDYADGEDPSICEDWSTNGCDDETVFCLEP
ncbi:MAG: hypothetical protein COT89_01455 [Candidatus Colwellbacteria bacterium CG10_big_fil_rev_8_21_14_0_10_42_22]|uniref:Type II secretion system protein GspG C-terminal domain-containing protein n=1 Tax=Candidatus Colwellbacteria bacterium CG10_big_fil_rev_8_21_14_0_10_42_22 TaxID=1974540 RepID=A0A2H0VG65_9BACT|nr:MAG: hypothetical protein COT89_01455 [Candidatus Colwellbacteria bacterium CG10_big_fil_rev_8_21_14_0_10_42_22]